MTPVQYRLLKVMEECTEVAQRASKQMQFGGDQVEPGQPFTNAERLRAEVLDLRARLLSLELFNEIPDVSSKQVWEHFRHMATTKWATMCELSISCGQVTK